LLIAPTIVLLLVVAGLGYAAIQLHVLGTVSDSFQERNAFISAVERGEKPLELRQALGMLRLALDVETKRTAAVIASRDLVIALSAIALVSCGVLLLGIRAVPREHWPRLTLGRSRTG
ncbi:MAG: hypothetical protein ACREBE_18000, partial [bacterium]